MAEPEVILGDPFRARFRCSHGHEWSTHAPNLFDGAFAMEDANGHPPEMLCLRCLKDLLKGKVGLVERIE